MEPLRITERPEALDDLEQHPLHEIVHVGLIPHAAADERPQVAVQLLPRQIGDRSHRASILSLRGDARLTTARTGVGRLSAKGWPGLRRAAGTEEDAVAARFGTRLVGLHRRLARVNDVHDVPPLVVTSRYAPRRDHAGLTASIRPDATNCSAPLPGLLSSTTRLCAWTATRTSVNPAAAIIRSSSATGAAPATHPV